MVVQCYILKKYLTIQTNAGILSKHNKEGTVSRPHLPLWSEGVNMENSHQHSMVVFCIVAEPKVALLFLCAFLCVFL